MILQTFLFQVRPLLPVEVIAKITTTPFFTIYGERNFGRPAPVIGSFTPCAHSMYIGEHYSFWNHKEHIRTWYSHRELQSTRWGVTQMMVENIDCTRYGNHCPLNYL